MPGRKDISLFRADGSAILKEVFVIVFYFDSPHLLLADSIAETIEDYTKLVGFELLSVYYDNEGEPQPLDSSALSNLIQSRFFGRYQAPNSNIMLGSNGAGPRDCFLWYNGKALDVPEFADEVGYLWCWMPRAFYLEFRTKTLQFLASLGSRLPFTFAYASLGLAERRKREMQALAKRHPGLDIAQPLCVSADLDHRAGGSYWTTFLGKRLTEACGGLTTLRASLPEGIRITDLEEGKTSLILGDDPEIGDVNKHELLPNYRALAKFLDDRAL